jgi:signal transduction histidine kinase
MPATARQEITREMRRLRDRVLLRWRQRVADEIPGSALLSDALLFDTMPELYDYLTLSIADPEGAGRTDIARAHGADRARQTDYRPCDLLREFQVLRRCMEEIAAEESLAMTREYAAALAASFDAVEREALEEYDHVQRREHDVARQAVAGVLRAKLNVIVIAAQRIMGTASIDRIAGLAHRIRAQLAHAEAALEENARHGAAAAGHLPLLLSTFELTALVREVCAEADRPALPVHGGSVIVTWCRLSVRQALRNLLAEARDAAGPVSVAVRHAHGRAVVSVLHRHVLPPDAVRMLFSARNKPVHPTLREWGTGLGFVRDVAESHGGSAIVHSFDGSGTEFRLDMPADASPFVATAG